MNFGNGDILMLQNVNSASLHETGLIIATF